MEITNGRFQPQRQERAPSEQRMSVTSNTEASGFPVVLHGNTPATGIATPSGGVGHATRALTALIENTLGAGPRVDAMLAAARNGKTFSPTQLLALQNDVFRYSQSIEVLSRTTDRLVGGLKQILNTPV